ncbi:Mitochondrial-processing peptidase subunit alpha [Borealophlyctis nickersoniae]|nr:Mitochondrial-processing peptidase subunit alpha [Borealophlyctis nickersoniae]
MAWKSTKNRTSEQISRELEAMGGSMMAQSSRDSIVYHAAVFPHDVARVVSVLSDVVKNPRFLPEEVDEIRQTTAYEIQDLEENMDMMLPEHLHALAFQRSDGQSPARGGDTWGRPLLCPMESLELMSAATLHEFHGTWYTPDRMVLAGVGMDHATLVSLAEEHFGDMQPPSPAHRELQQQSILPSKYTGGFEIIDTAGMPPPANPDDKILTRIYIAFEALSVTDPDVYAFATLTSLMGGGGSFSAGGPGKGMYTRLYTEVLNQHHWVESCSMIDYTYSDTGLFGIQAAVIPRGENHAEIVPILCNQLHRMTKEITQEELSRAKNQLKSALLMGLESKVGTLDDVGRQVLSTGKRTGALEMCRRIDMLTGEDLNRVARRLIFKSDEPSRLDFGNDTAMKPWKRTGDGNPTVLIQGPMFGEKDPLLRAEQTLAKWGIGAPMGSVGVGGRRQGLFGSLGRKFKL